MTLRLPILSLTLVVAATAAAVPCFAQPPKEPIPRFVVDVRGTSAGLPAESGWTPPVPADTELPSRAFGLDVGAHVYPWRFKSAALGFGATWDFARGRTSPPDVPPGITTPVLLLPSVTTRATSLSPQVSLNFGHSLGWSYLSAGLGLTRVESSAESQTTITYVPVDSGWVKTINYGGGARWFINDHLGVGFDLRWHKVSIVEPSATSPGAPRASLLTAAVGISLK
jgi:hypothetical protein